MACHWLQTDEDDRPVHPPVIQEVEVLWNPFEDIVPRSTREEREAAAAAKRCCSSHIHSRELCRVQHQFISSKTTPKVICTVCCVCGNGTFQFVLSRCRS